jgi:hypothetical protein
LPFGHELDEVMVRAPKASEELAKSGKRVSGKRIYWASGVKV